MLINRPSGVWLALALAGVLVGCLPVTDPGMTVDHLPAELNAAVADGDRERFDALFDPAVDPGRREQLWENLAQLADVHFTVAGDAWRVEWRLAGEIGSAYHLVEPEMDCRGATCRLIDLAQLAGSPAPIWINAPVEVQAGDGVSVIGGADAQQWLDAGRSALATLQAAGLPGVLMPPAVLVIEVPATTIAFEQVMAAPAVDFRGIGALTWVADTGRPAGATTSPVVRIVVNPDATASITEPGRKLLLVHEAVHAATSWLGAPAAGRRWVAEGLAEATALPVSSDEQRRSRDLLVEQCPLVTEPPPDDNFTDPGAAAVAYAWAGLAVTELLAGANDSEELIQRLWVDPAEPVPIWQVPAGLCT